MTSSDSVVYIVDDNPLVRDSLVHLVESVDLRAEIFSSARDFLENELPEIPCCLVLDIRMPGMSGLDLQGELATMEIPIPIIFITGHGTISMSVEAMKSGAVDFLQKPFEDQKLLDAIHSALELSKCKLEQIRGKETIKQRVASLSSREHEIFIRVVAGMLNKQIAYDLKINENTIKTHRYRMMRKMKAESLAELIQLAAKVNIPPVN